MTVRPNISDETAEKLESMTEDSFNVPAERVGFDNRVQVLMKRLSEAESELESVYSEIEDYKKNIEFYSGREGEVLPHKPPHLQNNDN